MELSSIKQISILVRIRRFLVMRVLPVDRLHTISLASSSGSQTRISLASEDLPETNREAVPDHFSRVYLVRKRIKSSIVYGI